MSHDRLHIAVFLGHVEIPPSDDFARTIKLFLEKNFPDGTFAIEVGSAREETEYAEPTDFIRFTMGLMDPMVAKYPRSTFVVSITPNMMQVTDKTGNRRQYGLFFMGLHNERGSEGFYAHQTQPPGPPADVVDTLTRTAQQVIEERGGIEDTPEAERDMMLMFSVLGESIDYVFRKRASRDGRFEPSPAHMN